jgi:hypothetical protein
VHILGYLILVFGVIGILLGLYGLLMPVLRRRGLTLSLPRLRRPFSSPPDDYGELDDVLVDVDDLESAGYRNSAFEAPPLVPLEAAPPRVVQVTSWTAPASEPPPDDDATLLALEPGDEAVDLLEELPELEGDELPASLDETVEVEAPPEEPSAGQQPAGMNSDMMALFSSKEEKSSLPEALRDAYPHVTMEELLADARAIHQLLSGTESSNTNVA